jgi:hypothetical protein
MVDVKEAVKSSASYLHSMQAILETSIQNVFLEEVEVSDDDEQLVNHSWIRSPVV